jgi:hypothetical protein
MSLPALRKEIAQIERSGFFRVSDARRLASPAVLGKSLSREEHAVLSTFKDRLDARRVDSSYQARRVVDLLVAKGPTGALREGVAVACGATKGGVKLGLLGALIGGAAAAVATVITGDHGPWAAVAAQNAVETGVGAGAAIGAATGVVRGARKTIKERD